MEAGEPTLDLLTQIVRRHSAAVFVNNLVASRILETEIRSLRDDFGLSITDDEGHRLFADLPT